MTSKEYCDAQAKLTIRPGTCKNLSTGQVEGVVMLGPCTLKVIRGSADVQAEKARGWFSHWLQMAYDEGRKEGRKSLISAVKETPAKICGRCENGHAVHLEDGEFTHGTDEVAECVYAPPEPCTASGIHLLIAKLEAE
jgi:hypothetical protein